MPEHIQTQQEREQQLLVEFHRLFESVEPRSPAHEALVDQLMLEEERSRLPDDAETTPGFTSAAQRIIRNTLLDNVRPDGYGAHARQYASAIFQLQGDLIKIPQTTHARPNVIDELHRANTVVNSKDLHIQKQPSRPAPTTTQAPIR